MFARGARERELTASGEALAGASAGALSRFVVAPLDVLKIRFQLQREPIGRGEKGLYRSVPQAVGLLLREEGLRTLWRGNASAMALWVTYMGVSFPAYREAHSFFERRLGSAGSTGGAGEGSGNSGTGGAPALASALCAGAVSGAVATVCTYPLDWLRTRLASQGVPREHDSAAALVRAVYASEGARGLFRGLAPTVLQIVPSLAVTFATYEQSGAVWDRAVEAAARAEQLQALAAAPQQTGADADGSGGRGSGGGRDAELEVQRRQRRRKQLRSLACGALAGTLGKLVVYPLDTVKKRLQVRGMRRDGGYGAAPREYTGTADALLAIAREEGVASGWFKGIGPSLLKAGLAAAATFFFYEASADVLREQPWAVRSSCERD